MSAAMDTGKAMEVTKAMLSLGKLLFRPSDINLCCLDCFFSEICAQGACLLNCKRPYRHVLSRPI